MVTGSRRRVPRAPRAGLAGVDYLAKTVAYPKVSPPSNARGTKKLFSAFAACLVSRSFTSPRLLLDSASLKTSTRTALLNRALTTPRVGVGRGRVGGAA